MDVVDIISELDDHGFQDTDSTRKVAIINDVAHDINSRNPWPYLEGTADITMTVGSANLTTPSDFSKALALVIPSEGQVLRPERMEVVTRNYPADFTSTQGLPFLYYFVGSSLRVFYVPDTAYVAKLRYLRTQTTLAESSVESDILMPSRHHRALVLGSLVRLYSMEDDPDLAAVFERQYEQRLLTIIEDLYKRQYDRPDTVLDVWDDGE